MLIVFLYSLIIWKPEETALYGEWVENALPPKSEGIKPTCYPLPLPQSYYNVTFQQVANRLDVKPPPFSR